VRSVALECMEDNRQRVVRHGQGADQASVGDVQPQIRGRRDVGFVRGDRFPLVLGGVVIDGHLSARRVGPRPKLPSILRKARADVV